MLARAKGVLTGIEAALVAAQIPYRVLSGTAFYQRREVKAALAHLALLVNPHDAEAFSRVMLDARRGIGEVTAARVDAHAVGGEHQPPRGVRAGRRPVAHPPRPEGVADRVRPRDARARRTSSSGARSPRCWPTSCGCRDGLAEILAGQDDGGGRLARLRDLVAAARAYERDAAAPERRRLPRPRRAGRAAPTTASASASA